MVDRLFLFQNIIILRENMSTDYLHLFTLENERTIMQMKKRKWLANFQNNIFASEMESKAKYKRRFPLLFSLCEKEELILYIKYSLLPGRFARNARRIFCNRTDGDTRNKGRILQLQCWVRRKSSVWYPGDPWQSFYCMFSWMVYMW